jgi:hypothetical protein
MAFDLAKDKVLMERKKDDVQVSLCQYNGRSVKIQISRLYKGEWTKLGRLTSEEAKFVGTTLIEFAEMIEGAKNVSHRQSYGAPSEHR